MSHVWGLFSHPDREMQVINRENETILTITPTTFC
ncbi:inner membrane protein [Escherichia coli]|uniref:Inner membrane protein n=1 Tax=Escherichia coli TaxID=562 RepID=A0A376ZIT7_ECOLX|nr:inner membrane protein [Escherichia coli]